MNNVRILVDNVKCKIQNLPQELGGALSNHFSVASPGYWFSPRYKSGMWDGTIKFFIRPANVFPTGLLEEMLAQLRKYDITPTIVDSRYTDQNALNPDTYELDSVDYEYQISDTKTARDYQVDALNSIVTHTVGNMPFMRGVINIATNGGKTAIAVALIKEIYPKLIANNTHFLFVTHSKEIAIQAHQSISEDAGIEVGMIGDGKWDVLPVTVALMPTLYRRRATSEYKELVSSTVGFIADECHHSSSDSWYKTFQSFVYASIRIGLTGTVDKSNLVNLKRLYSCTGSIIHKVTNNYLISEGYSAKPVCVVFTVDEPDLDRFDYADAYQLGIAENTQRLNIIREICDKETSNNNTVLILVEHIDHGENIEKALKILNKKVVFSNGNLSTEQRQEYLDNMREGKIDVLIATAILDEGVDVTNINAIIYARGMKSQRKLLQGIGRGLRKKDDGSQLRFYDFIDATHELLLKHSKQRIKVLQGEGFKMKAMTLKRYRKLTMEEIDHE